MSTQPVRFRGTLVGIWFAVASQMVGPSAVGAEPEGSILDPPELVCSDDQAVSTLEPEAMAACFATDLPPTMSSSVKQPVGTDGSSASPAPFAQAPARETSAMVASNPPTPTPPSLPAPPVALPTPAYQVTENHDVQRFLDQFQTGYRRAIVEKWLVRAGRYLPMVLDVFKQKGLPEELVFTAMIESGFDPLAVSRMGAVDPTILPPPAKVAVALEALLRSNDFLADSLDTVIRVVAAFVIGAPIALAAGFVMGENIGVGRSLSPIFNLVLSVPQSIFLPLFVLLFGLGFTEKLIFGITHVFFVVAVNAMAAVRQVSHGQVMLARSFGANRFRIYRSIYLPAMAPQVVTGLRLGLIFCIIGILLAEMYASRTGLGVLLLRWGESYAVDKLMAATVLISVATIIINETMRIWEVRVGRWRNVVENR